MMNIDVNAGSDQGAQYTGKAFTGVLKIMAFKSVWKLKGAV